MPTTNFLPSSTLSRTTAGRRMTPNSSTEMKRLRTELHSAKHKLKNVQNATFLQSIVASILNNNR